jgi:hypothetical protein
MEIEVTADNLDLDLVFGKVQSAGPLFFIWPLDLDRLLAYGVAVRAG